MTESNLGIDTSKTNYQILLNTEQTVPNESLFQDKLFKALYEKMRNRNEAMVIQDITQLIVPSAQNMAIYGAISLECLIESVNEG
jgi:hypothetical protein